MQDTLNFDHQPQPGSAEYEALKGRIEALAHKAKPNSAKQADKFRQLAERLESVIDNCTRPMTSNPTPKRMREYRSRLHDGDNHKRTQKLLLAMAAAHDAGTLPAILASLKTKDEISRLIYKGTLGGGYYDVIPDPEYRNKTPEAIAAQQLLEQFENVPTSERIAREKASQISQLEARVQFQRIPGYFPTPQHIAEKMAREADIKSGMRVLEPSAGKGNIAEAIRAYHPACKLDTVEMNPTLAEILRLKGFYPIQGDFLEHSGTYDRIVMNPPFENRQDIKHIEHARRLLAPGGILVAICANGSQRYDQLQPIAESWEPLDPGTFKESGTGVSAVLLTIRN